MKSLFRRLSAFVLIITVIFTFSVPALADDEWKAQIDNEINIAVLDRENSYTEYYSANKNSHLTNNEIKIEPTCYSSAAPDTALEKIDNFNGCNNVLLWGESPDYATWDFTVQDEGLYELRFEYYPLKQTSRDIEISLKLDGSYPFYEATSLVLNTAYKLSLIHI